LTYAVVISLILHLMVFAYMIVGGNPGTKEAYPRIITVDLVSMPPISRGTPNGVETPGSPSTEKAKTKMQSKVEEQSKTPHVAEIKKKKRPAKKKPKPKPKTKTEIAEKGSKPDDSTIPGIDEENIGLPEGVEFGSEFGTVQLEGATFETPTYLNILFAKIKYRWDNPFIGAEKISCTIYFSILRNGNVVDAAVERSSGIAAFDQSALRAVFSSKPPPLPLEYTGNSLGIHLEFQYLP